MFEWVRRGVVNVMIGVVVACLSLQGAEATDVMWTGSGDGSSFDDAANWMPMVVPGEFDTAIFDIGFGVTINNGAQNQRVDVGAAGTITLSGTNYTLNGAAVTVEVSGSLGVSNGELSSNNDALITGNMDVSDGGWQHEGLVTVDGTLQLTSANFNSFGADLSGSMAVENAFWHNNDALDVSGSLTLSSSGVEQDGMVDIGPFGMLTVDDASGLVIENHLQMSGDSGVSSLTVTNDSFLRASGLSAGASPGTFNITVQNGSGVHLVGPFADTFLATVPGSHVTVIVMGPFANWFSERNMTISDGGSATLTVVDGFVECRQGRIRPGLLETADVIVSGKMSGWVMDSEFDVGGGEGTTTMLIENGAFVDCADAFVGEDGTGSTTLTTTGLESEFFVFGEIAVGNANVVVSNGATMDSDDAFIGDKGGGGSVTVTGMAASWINLGQLAVGLQADGNLDVTDSGILYSGNAIVGLLPGATGTMQVSGAASMWASLGDIDVARFGVGTLNVDLGAVVTSTNGFVGGFAGSDGTVTIDGKASRWDNLGFVTIGGNAGTGSVVVSNNATLSAWQINVGRNGTLVVGESAGASTDQIVVAEGNVSGDGTLTGDVFNGGTISPLAQGDPTGILTLDGDYEQLVEGTLAIELAGLVPGAQYDRLVVTGAAELAGTLDLRLLDGFVPTMGDQFTILTADAGVAGVFDAVEGGIGFDIAYDANQVVLTFTGGGCPADLDGSGAVDFGDILAILTAWGNAGGPEDLDGSGTVDFGDILVVLTAWGPCE